MRQIVEVILGLGKQVIEDMLRPIHGLWEEIQRGNRSVRIKTAVVIGYLVVGLITVIVFVPAGELNEIDADVRIAKTEVVGGWYFLVNNHADEDWTDVVLTMNQVYTFRWTRLKAGKKKAFFFHRFKDTADHVPPKGLVVEKLRIECQQGDFEHIFSKR